MICFHFIHILNQKKEKKAERRFHLIYEGTELLYQVYTVLKYVHTV